MFVELLVLIQLRMLLVEILGIDAKLSFQCFLKLKCLHYIRFPSFLFNLAVLIYESPELEGCLPSF